VPEDTGRTAYGVLLEGGAAVGETTSIAGEHLTGAERFTSRPQNFRQRLGTRKSAFDG